MDVSFLTVIQEAATNPILAATLILSICVIIVNGATDASNAIATCVATRSMRPGQAIAMAAVFNFLGVSLMTFVSTAVANTIFKMVDLGTDSHMALIALMSAMLAMIVWGTTAWSLGIPTSQSHSLIAGITGAAIALQGSFHAVVWSEWVKVIYGLVFSIALGFSLGWIITRILGRLCRDVDNRRCQRPFGKLQDLAAALLAFMHGSQDGQKFMTVCMLGVILASGGSQADPITFPFWVMVLCAASMATGTAIGGKKIIKSVGMDMVKLEKWQGFSATLAASIAIFISTMTGLPISTTHTKTTAIMGVGTAKRASAVNWGAAKNMMLAWVFTFPGAGLIAFGLARFFLTVL